MEASILDLRYKMRDVLKALDRREKVTILYHGKKKGEIIPLKGQSKTKTSKHPIFGMIKDAEENPSDIVSQMRRRRHNAV